MAASPDRLAHLLYERWKGLCGRLKPKEPCHGTLDAHSAGRGHKKWGRGVCRLFRSPVNGHIHSPEISSDQWTQSVTDTRPLIIRIRIPNSAGMGLT